MSKGFVTIAAGNESYYRMAHNLLKSYRLHSNHSMPFAIICDRENEWTKDFDNVVVKNDMSKTYMDKLAMLSTPIYDENIFIDADCLVYRDLNDLFALMPASGTSCIGRKLPTTNTEDGWFSLEGIGKYAEKVNFIPQMHGGIIFFKDDNLTKRIYSESVKIAENYSKYSFKYFDKPADEPILALSIAANAGELIDVGQLDSQNIFVFFPTAPKVRANIKSGMLSYISQKGVRVDNVYLCHWQNCNTRHYQYKNEVLALTRHNMIFCLFNSIKNIAVDYVCNATTEAKRIIRNLLKR